MNDKTSYPHLSVLQNEVLQLFADRQLGVVVDGTLGAGGHSLALLENYPEITRLIGIDQDAQAREIAARRLAAFSEKTTIVEGNFRSINEHLDQLGISQVDGILLDVGVSSMQIDRPERGFSFMKEGPLDMRMDPSQELTAEIIVNEWSAEELGRIFRDYGEEKRWWKAAQVIVKARQTRPLQTTSHLAAILDAALYNPKKKIHPATLVFQALRIAVNGELDALREVLPAAIERLAPGGILAVISFHSLEDRIVKQLFRDKASDKESTSGIGGMFLDREPEVQLLTRKAIVATEEEIEINPRSRSARLRAVEKR